jgi:hypothetical protein
VLVVELGMSISSTSRLVPLTETAHLEMASLERNPPNDIELQSIIANHIEIEHIRMWDAMVGESSPSHIHMS